MSFFSAPAWAKPRATDDQEDERDLFSHSSKFLDIQKDSIGQKKKQAERLKQQQQHHQHQQQQQQQQRDRSKKEQAEREERRNASKRASLGDESPGGIKKRRINSEERKKLLALAGVTSISIDSGSDEDATPEGVSMPVRRHAPTQRTRNSFHVLQKPGTNVSSTVDTGHNSDDDLQITAVAPEPAPPPESEEEEDSDPEIAAIKRRAREKNRQARERQNPSTPPTVDAGSSRPGSGTPERADLTISLLVTSDLPDTTAMLVKRKMSQTLQAVKKAWCERQMQNGLCRDVADRVFLTWNGRKLYDFTTCQRLGIELDSRGRLIRSDARDADGAAQVHVVAMTPELFAHSQAERARQARASRAQHEQGEHDDDDDDEQQPAPPPPPAEIKLVVKAKGKPNFNVKVFHTTKLAKIIRTAKQSMKIPPDQPAHLQFDGERLDPGHEVGGTELEDMDVLDLLLGGGESSSATNEGDADDGDM